MKIRSGFTHAFGCAILFVVATGCKPSGKGNEVRAAAPPPINVQTTRLRTGEITRRITLPGNLRAYQETTLYAKVPGYLKSIAVDRGDWVKAGDALAEIETPETLAEAAKSKAEADVAEIDLKRINEAARKAPDLVMPQAVDAARGKAEIARANLERIETLLGYSKIIAPFAGVITKRWVDVGAFIPAATASSVARSAAVVTLMDFSRVRIEMAIPELETPLVKKDLPVKVTVEELPGRVFDGSITRFAYALDEATKTMMAEVEIPNPDHALRPGMYANCQIGLEKKMDAQLLPAGALITEKNRSFVFACRDGKAVRVPVKTGFDDGISVEILDGLKPDDAVIVVGKQSVTDGQTVNATEAR